MNTIMRAPPMRVRHQNGLRLLEVIGVNPISPLMRRITLAGEALEGFTSASPDDHVKLFFPEKGQKLPVLPELGPNGPSFAEGGPRPVARDYTPRHFNAEHRELVIEFVIHGDGPASNWAAHAKPGDSLAIGGPRGSLVISPDYDTYLLIGDETALPAIGRRLEEMPAGTNAIAVIEVADQAEERVFSTAANLRTIWLHRAEVPPGTSALLQGAVESLDFPQRDTHAWIACEREVARHLRQYLIEQKNISRDQIKAAGYWRHGEAGARSQIED